ncbi:MAG: hypothetical protein QOF26_1958 [Baekduia sp.]|nr:hypothetical protein [Baekduia sp.]
MAAAAGATGARTWLQTHHLTWMTPIRLRRVTIGLCAAALAVSTIGFSGSTASPPPSHGAAHATSR